MDYRRTKYCPELVDIKEKKKKIEALIKKEHPHDFLPILEGHR